VGGNCRRGIGDHKAFDRHRQRRLTIIGGINPMNAHTWTRKTSRKGVVAICCIALGIGLVWPSALQASIAFEIIADIGIAGDILGQITGLPTGGLTRARGYLDPLAIAEVETVDTVIASQNSVVNMGNFNGNDTSFVHQLSWLAPAANGVYTSATLYIAAAGIFVNGGPTTVAVGSVPLGSLNSAIGVGITSFPGVQTLLNNNQLSVLIDKGTVQGFFGQKPNQFSVIGSKLVVQYDSGGPPGSNSPVPEPTSFVVWAVFAGVGLVITKRLTGM
jgi:hypothetical protein